jgi:hypothetical protein
MAIVKKKVVRRRRKRNKKPYFGIEVHDAIVDYQSKEDISEKKDIYVAKIFPAFDKLAENLIFIHGFAKLSSEPYETLKSDCVSFLYETLEKFDPSRGTKAFSYFNVVAKNWLIIQSKKNTKYIRRHIEIPGASEYMDPELVEKFKMEAPQDFNIIKKESMENLFSLMEEIKGRLKSENELSCMNAIITLFTKIEDLDLLNKRAVFIYMRDLSNLNPKQLSVAMSTIRKHYRDLVKDDKFDIFFWS